MINITSAQTQTDKPPIYCRECRQPRKFDRIPERDRKSTDTGRVIMEAWQCPVCGHVCWGTAKW